MDQMPWGFTFDFGTAGAAGHAGGENSSSSDGRVVESMELSSTPVPAPEPAMEAGSQVVTSATGTAHEFDTEGGFNNNETVSSVYMIPSTEMHEWPSRLDALFRMQQIQRDEQTRHAWNSEDASEHIYVQENDPFTFHRHPTAQSTDAIRGKVGYTRGIHLWEVNWHHQQRGTHAVIGVSTKVAPLHVHGYHSLIGNNEDSWGWDITRCRALHDVRRFGWRPYPLLLPGNGKDHHQQQQQQQQQQQAQSRKQSAQPAGAAAKQRTSNNAGDASPPGGNVSAAETNPAVTLPNSNFRVPQIIYVILDMDEGTLSFAVDKQFLGVAFVGLKGKTVYPAVSAVWGHCEVTMHYMGGLSSGPLSLMQCCRRSLRREVKQAAKMAILLAQRECKFRHHVEQQQQQQQQQPGNLLSGGHTSCLHQLNNNNNMDLFTLDCLNGSGGCRRRVCDLASLIAGNKPNFVVHPGFIRAYVENLPIPQMHIDYLLYRAIFNNYDQLPSQFTGLGCGSPLCNSLLLSQLTAASVVGTPAGASQNARRITPPGSSSSENMTRPPSKRTSCDTAPQPPNRAGKVWALNNAANGGSASNSTTISPNSRCPVAESLSESNLSPTLSSNSSSNGSNSHNDSPAASSTNAANSSFDQSSLLSLTCPASSHNSRSSAGGGYHSSSQHSGSPTAPK